MLQYCADSLKMKLLQCSTSLYLLRRRVTPNPARSLMFTAHNTAAAGGQLESWQECAYTSVWVSVGQPLRALCLPDSVTDLFIGPGPSQDPREILPRSQLYHHSIEGQLPPNLQRLVMIGVESKLPRKFPASLRSLHLDDFF